MPASYRAAVCAEGPGTASHRLDEELAEALVGRL